MKYFAHFFKPFVNSFFLAQILFAKDADQRSSTFEKSLSLGEDFKRRTRLLVLRAAVLRNQIHVKVCIFNCIKLSNFLIFNCHFLYVNICVSFSVCKSI